MISFIGLRSFSNLTQNLGFNSLNLDPFFSVPYSYLNSPNNTSELRKLVSTIRSFTKRPNKLYLPHVRDPMLQLIAAATSPKQIDFIEEGCLFPRNQIIKDELYKDDIVYKVQCTKSFFSLPSHIAGIKAKFNLHYSPKFICTNDNFNLNGIALDLLSDIRIRKTLSYIAKELCWEFEPLTKNLIQIGTKDECAPAILDKALNITNIDGKNLSKPSAIVLTHQCMLLVLTSLALYLINIKSRYIPTRA